MKATTEKKATQQRPKTHSISQVTKKFRQKWLKNPTHKPLLAAVFHHFLTES
jgi:hypothetical protein